MISTGHSVMAPHQSAARAFSSSVGSRPWLFGAVFFSSLCIGGAIGLKQEPLYEAMLIVSIGMAFRSEAVYAVEFAEDVKARLESRLRSDAGESGFIDDFHAMRARHQDRYYAGVRILATDPERLFEYASQLRNDILARHREVLATGESMLRGKIATARSILLQFERNVPDRRESDKGTLAETLADGAPTDRYDPGALRERIEQLQEYSSRQVPTEVSVRVSSHPVHGIDFYLSISAMIGLVVAALSSFLVYGPGARDL